MDIPLKINTFGSMRNIIAFRSGLMILLAVSFSVFTGCSSSNEEFVTVAPQDVVMYQVNPRNFAPENSFRAVDARLDAIRDLGANTVWFMPICEIGVEKSVNSHHQNLQIQVMKH